MIFLNLESGIENIGRLKDKEYSFIRIQKDWYKKNKWNQLIQDLDNNFLMKIAINEDIIIYDGYGKNEETPEYLIVALDYIKAVCDKLWFNVESDVFNSDGLDISTKEKLIYFKNFLIIESFPKIKIKLIKTTHDNDYNWYKKYIKKQCSEKIDYQDIHSHYLELNLIKSKLTSDIRNLLKTVAKKEDYTTEDMKRLLTLHANTVEQTKKTQYPVKKRTLKEFFGQKVYQSAKYIYEDYKPEGKYNQKEVFINNEVNINTTKRKEL